VTAVAWILAFLEICLGVSIVVAVLVDVWLVQNGKETISLTTLELAARYPWTAAAVGAVWGLVLAAFASHLYTGAGPAPTFWEAGMLGGLGTGVLVGLFCFRQQGD
jgi:hypothetical protein